MVLTIDELNRKVVDWSLDKGNKNKRAQVQTNVQQRGGRKGASIICLFHAVSVE
jgi:hypothetical protein